MVMTDEEIRTQYREAKNKRQQIEILADLNVCTKKAMTEKLTSLGLIEGKKQGFDSEIERRCQELYEQELCDAEIAAKLGKPRSEVVAWRKSKGLPAYYPSHTPKESSSTQARPRPICESVTYQIPDEAGLRANLDVLDKTVTLERGENIFAISFGAAEAIAELVREMEEK